MSSESTKKLDHVIMLGKDILLILAAIIAFIGWGMKWQALPGEVLAIAATNKLQDDKISVLCNEIADSKQDRAIIKTKLDNLSTQVNKIEYLLTEHTKNK